MAVTIGAGGGAAAPSISPTGDSNTGIFFPAADTIAFAEGGVEAARIDSSGRLLVGTSSARSTYLGAGISAGLNVEGAGSLGGANRAISVINGYSAGTDGGGMFYIGRTRSDSIGGTTVVQNGDQLGSIFFCWV